MNLTLDQCDALDREIDSLNGKTELRIRDVEETFGKVLNVLLVQEGFGRINTPRSSDGGVDFIWERNASGDPLDSEKCGVTIKYYRNKVGISELQKLLAVSVLGSFNRALLVSNSEFTQKAHDLVNRELPVKVELVGLSDLKNWVARFRNNEPDIETEVRIIMRDLSEILARMIARDKSTLVHLEWRDVERVVAEVFDGLGFRVALTPGSKDGGKDVVVTCFAEGREAEYYIEIKHWRSSTKVGSGAVEKLLKVIVEEKKDGGMFLSTYGFTCNAFEQLTTIDRQKLCFGDQERIATFCKTYVKAKAGLWSPPENLGEVLFDKKN
jgi:HJR/Mrr/RecB family endonuclease